jgi:hypothetical protein
LPIKIKIDNNNKIIFKQNMASLSMLNVVDDTYENIEIYNNLALDYILSNCGSELTRDFYRNIYHNNKCDKYCELYRNIMKTSSNKYYDYLKFIQKYNINGIFCNFDVQTRKRYFTYGKIIEVNLQDHHINVEINNGIKQYRYPDTMYRPIILYSDSYEISTLFPINFYDEIEIQIIENDIKEIMYIIKK